MPWPRRAWRSAGWAASHPRFHTPYLAILLQAVWSCALVATGTYRAAVHARDLHRVDLLRADDGGPDAAAAKRRIRAALSRVGLARWCRWCSPSRRLGVAAIQIAADPWQAASGLGIVVLGLPVYYIWIRPHAHR